MAVSTFTFEVDVAQVAGAVPVRKAWLDIAMLEGRGQVDFDGTEGVRVFGSYELPKNATTFTLTLPHTNIAGANPIDFTYKATLRIRPEGHSSERVLAPAVFKAPVGGPATIYYSDKTDPTFFPPPTPTVADVVAADRETTLAARDEAMAAAASVQREQPGGVAGLDGTGKIYETRIPERLSDASLSVTYARMVSVPANVADGIADAGPAIQAALNTAVGGTVWLPDGLYRIASQVVLPSSSTLHLSSGATLLRAMDGSMLITAGDDVTGGYGQAANITIRGGTISGNGMTTPGNLLTTAHCSGVTVEGVRFTNNGGNWHYIEFNSTAHITVRDCMFDTPIGSGISEMVQLDYASDAGAAPRAPFDGTPCMAALFTGCRFIGNSATAVNTMGVGTHQARAGFPIMGVAITDCWFEALNTGVRLGDWANVAITGNTFTGCSFAGVAPVAAVNYPVSNNATNWAITGNTFRACGARAIEILGGASLATTKLKNVTISNNAIDGSPQYGVLVSYATQVNVTGNVVTNIDTDMAGTAGGALWVTACKQVTIQGNTLQSAVGHATGTHITLNVRTAGCEGITIVGNRALGRGITVTDTDKAVVMGNLSDGNINKATVTNYNQVSNLANGVWVP